MIFRKIIFASLISQSLSGCHALINASLPEVRSMTNEEIILQNNMDRQCIERGLNKYSRSQNLITIKNDQSSSNTKSHLYNYKHSKDGFFRSIRIVTKINGEHKVIRYSEIPERINRHTYENDMHSESKLLSYLNDNCGKNIFKLTEIGE